MYKIYNFVNFSMYTLAKSTIITIIQCIHSYLSR